MCHDVDILPTFLAANLFYLTQPTHGTFRHTQISVSTSPSSEWNEHSDSPDHKDCWRLAGLCQATKCHQGIQADQSEFDLGSGTLGSAMCLDLDTVRKLEREGTVGEN
jgi:hypothetical protein